MDSAQEPTPPGGQELTDFETERADLLRFIVAECQRRYLMRTRDLVPLRSDSPNEVARKQEIFYVMLHKWAADPVLYIQDCGWAPDPKGDFGGRDHIPEGLAPPGMVPIILFPEHLGLIRDLDRAVNASGILDVNLVKSRQQAATAIGILFAEHGWRFRSSFPILLTSYSTKRIDPGGKGHRRGDSLFSRFRATLDAFMWQFPFAPFNAHRAWPVKRRRADPDNPSGLGDTDDTTNKIQRPRWFFGNRELFSRAAGNYVVGEPPSDTTGKGDIFAFAMLDEFGEYNTLEAGRDKKARESLRFACKHIYTPGTIPEGGGAGTEFKRLFDQGDGNSTLINRTLHWSDTGPYMCAAWFICGECGLRSDYGNPLPGPGVRGIEKVCSRCGFKQTVRRPRDIPAPGEVASPLYIELCKSLNWDRVAIARYLNLDWLGGAGDTFFTGFRASRALVLAPGPRDYPIMVEGFDPGSSTEYPAAWILATFDPVRAVPRVVGYWMASQTYAEWWVPFFKRWKPASLERHHVQFGTRAGRRFSDLGYPPEALEMLARVARWPLGRSFGDASGASHWMNDSPYDVLAGWGVHIDYSHKKDREMVVRRGRDWAVRVEIDPAIANIRPPSPSGRLYPSILEVFEGAKPAPVTGQARPKVDVDSQDPPYVKNACDAWFYACRAFADLVHARPDDAGEWSAGAYAEEAEPFYYGGDHSLG